MLVAQIAVSGHDRRQLWAAMKPRVRTTLIMSLCVLSLIGCAKNNSQSEAKTEVPTETLTGSLFLTAPDADATFERPDSGIDWGTDLPEKNEQCSGTGLYENISVTVEDQSDEILGAATLEGKGTITDWGAKPILGGRYQFFATCEFQFEIDGVPSDRTFYVVSADSERLTLSKEELATQDWHVEVRVSDS